MLKRIWKLIFGRSINDAINETKKVKVEGVNFVIRKINILDHMQGAKVLKQIYDSYKVETAGPKAEIEVSEKRIKEHYRDVLMAGVVDPALSAKEGEPNTIFVDKMFCNWDLVNGLYAEIMAFAYGKKKLIH